MGAAITYFIILGISGLITAFAAPHLGIHPDSPMLIIVVFLVGAAYSYACKMLFFTAVSISTAATLAIYAYASGNMETAHLVGIFVAVTGGIRYALAKHHQGEL